MTRGPGRRWWGVGVLAAVGAASACFPPPANLFTSPPPGHELIGAFVDTVWVARTDGSEVVPVGVRLLDVLTDGARTAGRPSIAEPLRGIRRQLAVELSDSVRARSGAELLWAELNRHGPVRRMDVARADLVVVREVMPDTVEREVADRTPEPWIALRISGDLWLDPAAGRRPDIP